ncbi:MAG: hypothetical protein ABFS23_14240, partial [Pseudomonadota bacterium]
MTWRKTHGEFQPPFPIIGPGPTRLDQLAKKNPQGIGDLPEPPIRDGRFAAYRVEIAINICGGLLGEPLVRSTQKSLHVPPIPGTRIRGNAVFLQ